MSSSKSGGGGSSGGGNGLTIYSSLPLQGSSRAQSEAIVNGAKLALAAVGGKVNGTKVTDTGKRFKVPGHPASARMGH